MTERVNVAMDEPNVGYVLRDGKPSPAFQQRWAAALQHGCNAGCQAHKPDDKSRPWCEMHRKLKAILDRCYELDARAR